MITLDVTAYAMNAFVEGMREGITFNNRQQEIQKENEERLENTRNLELLKEEIERLQSEADEVYEEEKVEEVIPEPEIPRRIEKSLFDQLKEQTNQAKQKYEFYEVFKKSYELDDPQERVEIKNLIKEKHMEASDA